MIPCDYCGKPFEPVTDDQRFCCPKHKAVWHRENVQAGTIKNWRPLKDGTYSVNVRYDSLPKGIRIGGAAWLETCQSTRTDAAQDIEND